MHAPHAAPPPPSIAPPPASARDVRAPLPPCPPAQPPRRAPRALAHRHRSLAPTHRHRGCAQATTRANLMRIAARRESLAEEPTTTANPNPNPRPHPHPHPPPHPHPHPHPNASPHPRPSPHQESLVSPLYLWEDLPPPTTAEERLAYLNKSICGPATQLSQLEVQGDIVEI